MIRYRNNEELAAAYADACNRYDGLVYQGDVHGWLDLADFGIEIVGRDGSRSRVPRFLWVGNQLGVGPGQLVTVGDADAIIVTKGRSPRPLYLICEEQRTVRQLVPGDAGQPGEFIDAEFGPVWAASPYPAGYGLDRELRAYLRRRS